MRGGGTRGGRRSRRGVGIGRGSAGTVAGINGVARAVAAPRLDGIGGVASERAGAGAANKRRTIEFRPRAELYMPRALFLRARWSNYTGCAHAKTSNFAVRR